MLLGGAVTPPAGPPGFASTATTVPRTAAIAFGVRMSTLSPGFIFSRATARLSVPDVRAMVDLPGTSVMVTRECSRSVSRAVPPRRTRASAWSPVTILSWRNTSSRYFSATGSGAVAWVATTLPWSWVTTPALTPWAGASVGPRSSATDEASAAMRGLEIAICHVLPCRFRRPVGPGPAPGRGPS